MQVGQSPWESHILRAGLIIFILNTTKIKEAKKKWGEKVKS